MATALYRRYRPESFAELIGQAQVTDPLITALKTNRVNHAYLFSGPRGCGKTTSARILARCLNCAEGPTPEPCGKCPSCIELSRDGAGSLDVVEIDAASHNGVDDARDLRERAGFAPARDRFKIFILDEAHMVTTQGFNALLKIVEEPPEHVKFIFATTEPDKVISTIRSRTHHYPFRLAPPNVMLDYLNELLEKEKATADPGVLSLVTRAGGGSFRDTLSVLDQLIAGSDGPNIDYDRTVALLGYTHSSLLDEVTASLADQDSTGVFKSVDRVIQTGQDPKRFAEDLLERFRDLILVAATKGEAASIIRGADEDELHNLANLSAKFGAGTLSKLADVIAEAITELSGATSPKLQLEILMARLLAVLDQSSNGGSGASGTRVVIPREPEPVIEPVKHANPAAVPMNSAPAAEPAGSSQQRVNQAPPAAPRDPDSVTLELFQNSWEQILNVVSSRSRPAWTVLLGSMPRLWEEGVLHIAFATDSNMRNFKANVGQGSAPDHLRNAITQVLGVSVKFRTFSPGTAAGVPPVKPVAPKVNPATPGTAPKVNPVAPEVAKDSAPDAKIDTEPVTKPAPESSSTASLHEGPSYGDAVVREILNAKPIEKDK